MITTLRGIVHKKTPPYLLIEVNGMGYEVQAPMTTFYQLASEQETVLLHTHLIVREDAHQLYGFATEHDRDLFRILIKANGVGPKLALSILSGMESNQLITAICQNDDSSLVKIPGVGKKTAQRLTIECQDAIKKLHHGMNTLTHTPIDGNKQDAIEALIALGYKETDAKKSIQKIHQTGQSTQEIIRFALQEMVGV